MPDLNSLPPSNPSSALPSPAMSTSHQTATTTSPSLSAISTNPSTTTSHPHPQQQPTPLVLRGRVSPRFERRRSGLLSFPSDAASASSSPVDPPRHHSRAPSLGELHQELENEQEAQVNRLLAQIRAQQAQLATYERSRSGSNSHTNTTTTAPQEFSPSATATGFPRSRTPSATRAARLGAGHSPILRGQHSPVPSTPSAVSRQSSVQGGATRRPQRDSQVIIGLGESAAEGRDEVALAQAEAISILRENQMLKGRIRELESELERMRVGASPSRDSDHGPSNL